MADIPVGFRPINYDSGQVKSMLMNTSVTVTKGDALAFTSGYVRRAINTDTKIKYVALEGKTDDGTNEGLLCVRTDGVEFLATTDSTPAQSQVGSVADLVDHNTVDENAASTDYVFEITEVVDTTNNIIKGYFHPTISA